MQPTGRIHILHLVEGALRWVTLRRQGRQLALETGGEQIGDAIETLDRWASGNASPDDEFRLYDSRPRYYNFNMVLPASAARRVSGAVAIKVRQELGVGPETVAWATRMRKRADGSGMLDIFTIVARRDAINPLADWANRRQFDSFWLGADVDAIRCLVEGGLFPAPILVLNDDPAGASVYHADGNGAVIKGRVNRKGEVNGCLPPDLSANLDKAGLTRAPFGGDDWHWLSRQAPRIESVPKTETLAGFTERMGAGGRLRMEQPRILERDAVLAGAVRDLTAKRYAPQWLGIAPAGAVTPIDSFIETGKPKSQVEWVDNIEKRLPEKRRLRKYLIIAACAFIIGTGSSLSIRAGARARLSSKLLELRGPEAIYRSQQAVMTMIAGERQGASVLPVIQAIHEAAPQNMNVSSVSIGDDGMLHISFKSREREQSNQFFRALVASPQFANVKLQEIGPAANNGIGFEVTAEIPSRKPKGRR